MAAEYRSVCNTRIVMGDIVRHDEAGRGGSIIPSILLNSLTVRGKLLPTGNYLNITRMCNRKYSKYSNFRGAGFMRASCFVTKYVLAARA